MIPEVSVFNTFLGNYCIKGHSGVLEQAFFVPNGTEVTAHTAHRKYLDVLQRYFAGEGRLEGIAYAISGTNFQQRVLESVAAIPYGEVLTYAQLSRNVGTGANPRNVGQANARNPLAVIIPCHRVVGQGMALAGYAWGLERKQKLLELEGAFRQQRLF